MKELFATKKWLWGVVGAGAAAVVAAVVLIVIFNRKAPVESYRSIVVHELEGITVIKSEEVPLSNAFKGENLYNGDDATVNADASITLRLDSDKYIYAESNAHFWLDATGTEGNGRTIINTDCGDTLHHLENKLGVDEIYNVSTPASTMSVRGTVFRVYVYIENGVYYTYLEVYQGAVEVELFTTEHNSVGVVRMVNAGECALMRASTDFSEFIGVNGCSADENAPIDYHNVPQHVAQNLGTVIDSGEELSITKELLFDYVEITPHEFETTIIKEATCTEDGESEEVCTVCGLSNGVVTIPAIGHSVETVVTEGSVCTEGITTNEVCNVCGEVLSENNEVSAHTYTAWKSVKVASCTENGTEERVCSVCNDKQTRTTVATGHVFSDYMVIADAGCSSEGSEKRVCSNCGLEETKSIAALGHSDSISVIREADCTEGGQQVRTCGRCGRSVVEDTAKLPHMWSQWTEHFDTMSCTDPSRFTRSCANPGCLQMESMAGTHDMSDTEHGEDSDGTPVCMHRCTQCEYIDYDSAVPAIRQEGATECPVCHKPE